MSSKVSKAIAALVFDEKLDVLKKLKVFFDGKMDDADDVTDMIDEFMKELSIKPVKVEKAKVDKYDKPKRTRKPTFYNFWLGQRLKTFAEEQKNVPDDEKAGKGGRMKLIALEWKDFKEGDDFSAARDEWVESSSSDETPKVEVETEEADKVEVKKEEDEKKKKKKKKEKEVVSSTDSDTEDDNSPQAINSDSEDDI